MVVAFPLPTLKVILSDGTEREIHGATARMVLMVLAADDQIKKGGKGEVEMHWTGTKASGKVTTPLELDEAA